MGGPGSTAVDTHPAPGRGCADRFGVGKGPPAAAVAGGLGHTPMAPSTHARGDRCHPRPAPTGALHPPCTAVPGRTPGVGREGRTTRYTTRVRCAPISAGPPPDAQRPSPALTAVRGSTGHSCARPKMHAGGSPGLVRTVPGRPDGARARQRHRAGRWPLRPRGPGQGAARSTRSCPRCLATSSRRGRNLFRAGVGKSRRSAP